MRRYCSFAHLDRGALWLKLWAEFDDDDDDDDDDNNNKQQY
jgi:hypothetical protein